MSEDKKTESTQISTFLGLVIIGAVLIAIIVPNISRGPYSPEIRAKAARAMADMRSLSTAIESYYVDYEAYPPWTQSANRIDWYSTVLAPSFDGRHSITTPIPYIMHLPGDPFSPDKSNPDTYAYWSCDNAYLLWSSGPDGNFDIYHPDMEALALVSETDSDNTTQRVLDKAAAEAYLLPLTFDITNGTDSVGDIWRWGFREDLFSNN